MELQVRRTIRRFVILWNCLVVKGIISVSGKEYVVYVCLLYKKNNSWINSFNLKQILFFFTSTWFGDDVFRSDVKFDIEGFSYIYFLELCVYLDKKNTNYMNIVTRD